MQPLDLRAALDALLADYVYVLDEDVLDQWPDFFVDDCLYQIIPPYHQRHACLWD